MVVKYAHYVSDGGFSNFVKLLFRWRGSVYKLVWRDMLVYMVLYAILSLVYRLALADAQKRTFEEVVGYFSSHLTLVPLSVLLGFFVAEVVVRWWGMFQSLPNPDRLAIRLAVDVENKHARAQVIRYINLGIAMSFRYISPSVNKVFCTLDDLVDAGYLMVREKEILEKKNVNMTDQSLAALPFLWASRVVAHAKKEDDAENTRQLLDEILEVQTKCEELTGWLDNNVPLVFTQVVTIAVYCYFLMSVVGEQFFISDRLDMYVPVLGLLRIFFCLSWLKVAESLLNPFGTDDHDFECLVMLKEFWETTHMLAEARPHGRPVVEEVEYTKMDEGEDDGGVFSLTQYLVDKLFPKAVSSPPPTSEADSSSSTPEEDASSTTEIVITAPTQY